MHGNIGYKQQNLYPKHEKFHKPPLHPNLKKVENVGLMPEIWRKWKDLDHITMKWWI